MQPSFEYSAPPPLSSTPLDLPELSIEQQVAACRVRVQPQHPRSLSEPEQEAVITEYRPFIQTLAYKLSHHLPSGVDVDDLVSVGTIGLLTAFANFDHTAGTQFKTYAEYRITGAMKDELRRMGVLSRRLQDKLDRVAEAYRTVANRTGHEPSDEEMAGELHMAIEAYHNLLAKGSLAMTLSLDDLGLRDEDGATIRTHLTHTTTSNPLDALVSEQTRNTLAKAIEALPAKEKELLALLYIEQLQMQEVATMFKVHPAQISRTHSKIILKLRTRIRRTEDPDIPDNSHTLKGGA